MSEAGAAPWDMARLSESPAARPADGVDVGGLRAIQYDSVPWRGRPTRAFAFVGLPGEARRELVPGIVLVHGGGGTAFPDWVRLWTGRGYAAIAMDTCGCVWRECDSPYTGPWPRHEHGGPAGWGGWDTLDEPLEDQWVYHSVAAAVLGHSLLRSLPEVDKSRVGLTGISWGGIIACIVAGIDARLRFVVPVYGCGFLGGDSRIGRDRGEAELGRWLSLWDPSRWLGGARAPMLWMTGTNDTAFPLPALRQSYRLAPGERTLCVPVRMVHGHGGPGERPPEILAFADSIVRGGQPLARITRQEAHGRTLLAGCRARSPVVRADLNYTADAGPWPDRIWHTQPADVEIDRSGPLRGRPADVALPEEEAGHIRAAVPEEATAAYLNLVDQRALMVSTEHVTFD